MFNFSLGIRILRKKPDLVDEILQHCENLLNEKSHGILMCAVNLATEILKIKPEAKKIFLPSVDKLMRLLKDISGQYSSEYDVDGVNDPFLQVAILKFLGLIATEGDLKEDFSSILATLTVNLP